MSPVSRATASDVSALQQRIAALAIRPEIASAAEWFRAGEEQIANWQLGLAAIPAPPFGEADRAQWLASRFVDIGLSRVGLDAIGNVVGVVPGTSPEVISVSAHIDTVFPAGTPLNVSQEGRKLYGAGISDNAAGVAALLAIASAISVATVFSRSAAIFWFFVSMIF